MKLFTPKAVLFLISALVAADTNGATHRDANRRTDRGAADVKNVSLRNARQQRRGEDSDKDSGEIVASLSKSGAAANRDSREREPADSGKTVAKDSTSLPQSGATAEKDGREGTPADSGKTVAKDSTGLSESDATAEKDSREGEPMDSGATAEKESGEGEPAEIEESRVGEEPEQVFTEVDISVGCTLIGGVTFVFVLFSLVNYEDDDIRHYAWALVSMVGAIFVGVMIYQAVNRWVLTYTLSLDAHVLVGVQYIHLFIWICCLQLTLAISSGTIGEGAEHSLELEQWVISDALRADFGQPVCNAEGEYDESVVRNRTGTRSVMRLDGMEVPVEKKKSAYEQRHRRMKCWSTLLAHMCAFAAIHTGGTLQQLPIFSAHPMTSVAPIFINQAFIHVLFLVFWGIRFALQEKAHAAGRKGVRAAMFDDFATDTENDISSLAGSFLVVQSIRYCYVGKLPTMEGELDERTPWHIVGTLYATGLLLTVISVLIIVAKKKMELNESSYGAHLLKLTSGTFGNGFAWCWLFASQDVFLNLSWMEEHGIGMETISGRILLSVILSLFAASLIFILDHVNDVAKKSSAPGKSPGMEIVGQLVFAKSILVGFCWEHAFEGCVEAIADDTAYPLYVQSALAVFMFFIVVPSWRRHILRKSLMLESYRTKRNQAELERTSYSPIPSSPRDIGPAYSAIPTEEDSPKQARNLRVENGSGDADIMQLTQEESANLGMAKALTILGGKEAHSSIGCETLSVYGAAIALPQVARSSGWPLSMCILTMRSYIFVLLNYFVQTAFVYYIYDSQTNMNPFGGQMHLCDFASHIDKCPNSPDCHGPGGNEIPDPGALYPFDIWNTRRFIRDSLKAIFPDRQDDIAGMVDPGEYGLESYYCRILCIFVFVLQIADEFQNIRDLWKMLRRLPANETPWIQYDAVGASQKKGDDPNGDGELQCVHFSVTGMPVRWKIINALFLLLPRIFIWRMLTMAGVHFLMETAAMVDQIVNTTALSFVLTSDELILERLATKATRHIMSNLEEYHIYEYKDVGQSKDEVLKKYKLQELVSLVWVNSSTFPLIPHRLMWTAILIAAFTAEYYMHNCRRLDDGSWVSIDVFLPLNPHMNFVNFLKKFLSWPQEGEGTAFWTMPGVS